MIPSHHNMLDEFTKSDLRRLKLVFCDGVNEVYTYIYQIDILRLIKLCELKNNSYYSEKFRRLIIAIDNIMNETSDLNRPFLPRKYLEKEYLKRDILDESTDGCKVYKNKMR